MTRKWIAARIDQLDPATDYDEIWKLSAAYRPNRLHHESCVRRHFPSLLRKGTGTRCLSLTTVTGKF